MSTINVSGQGRALPFTGFAALPMFLIGAFLSIVGGVMALLGPKRKASSPNG
jgi:predicted phage tail protein